MNPSTPPPNTDPVARLVLLQHDINSGLSENDRRHRDQTEAIEKQYVEQNASYLQQEETAIGDLDLEFTEKLEHVRRRYEDQVAELENLRAAKSDEISLQRAQAIEGAASDCEQAEIQIKDRREHETAQLKKSHTQLQQRCAQGLADINALVDESQGLLTSRGVSLPVVESQAEFDKNAWSSTLIRAHEASIDETISLLRSIRNHRASRFLSEGWTILLFIAICLVAGYPIGVATSFQMVPWIAGVIVTAGVGSLIAHLMAHRAAAAMMRSRAPQLATVVNRGRLAIQYAQKASERETKAGQEELKNRADEDWAQANRDRQLRMDEAEATFELQTQALENNFQQQLKRLEQNWSVNADKVRQHFRPQLQVQRDFYEQQRVRLTEERDLRLTKVNQRHADEKASLLASWQQALAEFERYADRVEQHDIHRELTEIKADDGSVQLAWLPPVEVPLALPIGYYQSSAAATAINEALQDGPDRLPALLRFPQPGSMILKASDEGRDAAVLTLRHAAMQFLTSFPPGKVRMTLIDPVGLGENFSALMHLADYDERLVGNRIWTETGHINQRLADLTEHMENVIQTYLRNEYASIQEYNEAAGEVAEPFRLLIIANFPHRFSEDAMRRLVSIVNGGARCGIYTLMSVDLSAKLPSKFRAEDLEGNAHLFDWLADQQQFQDPRPLFETLPLKLSQPVPDKVATQLLRDVGRHAQETQRVQVPFASVTPDSTSLWRESCDDELVVGLGRSGATKLQSMRLGRGTSQHVLISGKTGSGKSTLLNALITNAALHYSPDEVQFYLIDFKKGVEFKAYADLKLPHARVIAIESEREFGLSVLQRLDVELQTRGDLFRDAGVQSLAAFREKRPDHPLPRILFIVDEFQEFFVNDDRVSHEASLLLDRLVRQGRAFGMHVVLGSQTLAGAYSLARSTLGQMAVRIALQCSAADAHLILSEDNTAARLLGRPGEAIYNDANGTVEGNHPFQVVWLPDEERNESLRAVRDYANKLDRNDPAPIVFEGQAMSNLANNQPLTRLLQQRPESVTKGAVRAWVGAAVEIKDPTSVTLRRQGGSNLLVVGQNEELAKGVLASSLISLVAGHSFWTADEGHHCGAAFHILDGARADTAETDFGDFLQAHLTVPLNVVGVAQASSSVNQIFKQVETRLEQPEVRGESIYLMVYDLARFRDLRPDPDDFGLGSFGEAATESAAAQFSKILREGPAVGVHTMIWADCYHTVSRNLDRSTLRDIAHRILFQMSAADSSHLMDSVAAAQLGSFRGLLCDHDRGQSEKFRPYHVPSSEWLQSFQHHLNLTEPVRDVLK